MISITRLIIEFRTTCLQCSDQQEHSISVERVQLNTVDMEDPAYEHLKSEGWENDTCPRCCAKGKEESHEA